MDDSLLLLLLPSNSSSTPWSCWLPSTTSFSLNSFFLFIFVNIITWLTTYSQLSAFSYLNFCFKKSKRSIFSQLLNLSPPQADFCNFLSYCWLCWRWKGQNQRFHLLEMGLVWLSHDCTNCAISFTQQASTWAILTTCKSAFQKASWFCWVFQ